MNKLIEMFDADTIADMLKIRNSMFNRMPIDDEWPDKVDALATVLSEELELSDDDSLVAADELMQLEWQDGQGDDLSYLSYLT